MGAPRTIRRVVANEALAEDCRASENAPMRRDESRGAESEGAHEVNGGGRCLVVGRDAKSAGG